MEYHFYFYLCELCRFSFRFVFPGLSLEELDRETNCPETVDKVSWANLCKLRREKIELEEIIRVLG